VRACVHVVIVQWSSVQSLCCWLDTAPPFTEQVSHLLCRASALLCICMWSGGLCPGLALGAASSVAFTGHVLCPGTGPKVTLSQRNCWLGVCTCKYNE
jgi:hypothetical protein